MFQRGKKVTAQSSFVENIPNGLFVEKGDSLTILAYYPEQKLVCCQNDFQQMGNVSISAFQPAESSAASNSAGTLAGSSTNQFIGDSNPMIYGQVSSSGGDVSRGFNPFSPRQMSLPVKSGSSTGCLTARSSSSQPNTGGVSRIIPRPTQKPPPPPLTSRPVPVVPRRPLDRVVSEDTLPSTTLPSTSTHSAFLKQLSSAVNRGPAPAPRTGVSAVNPPAAAPALADEPWYLGKISRTEAEELLSKANVASGTFLVRESDTVNGFVISIKDGATYRHRKVIETNGFLSSWADHSFRSLQELVQTHRMATGDNTLQIPYNKTQPLQRSMSIPETRPPPPPQPSRLLSVQAIPENPNQNAQANPHQRIPASPEISNQNTQSLHIQATTSIPDIPAKNTQSIQGQMSQNIPRIPPPPSNNQIFQPNPQPRDLPIPPSAPPLSQLTLEERYPDLQQWLIRPSEIRKVEQIGSGHYGFVWRGVNLITDKEVAMKTLNRDTMDIDQFLEEAKTMKHLRHPFLVQLYGICVEPETFLLMEYHQNGNVENFVRTTTLSDSEKLKISQNVASGMGYLADMNYIHRDLAARNVLLAKDLSPKIADFGLARMMKENIYTQNSDLKMAYRWTAPEVLENFRFWSSKCDVWSFGVFCWELYRNCDQIPYRDVPEVKNSRDLLQYLNQGYRLKKPDQMPAKMFSVLASCWEREPERRPCFKDLIGSLQFSTTSFLGQFTSSKPKTSINLKLPDKSQTKKIFSGIYGKR